jgi:hypothetical protein
MPVEPLSLRSIKRNNGTWILLGIYPGNAGTAQKVVISNTGANGYAVADLVFFEIVRLNSDCRPFSSELLQNNWAIFPLYSFGPDPGLG